MLRISYLIAFVCAVGAVSIISLALQAEDRQTDRLSVVANHKASATASEVAREVLRLQEQLGGSVVDDRPQLENLPLEVDGYVPTRIPARSLHPHRYHNWDTSLLAWPAEQAMVPDGNRMGPPRGGNRIPVSKVSLLRETALLLDTRAHDLESLDLYEQADALREVASRLRTDARAMKREAESPPPTRP